MQRRALYAGLAGPVRSSTGLLLAATDTEGLKQVGAGRRKVSDPVGVANGKPALLSHSGARPPAAGETNHSHRFLGTSCIPGTTQLHSIISLG